MSDVNMPKLSDTMEEGTVVEWKKKSGDVVKKGEVIAEVESDKATFDLEAESDGVLSIIVEQGVPAKIGAPIARIGEASAAAEKPAPATPAPKAAAKPPKPEAAPEPETAEPEAAETPEPQPATRAGRDGEQDGARRAQAAPSDVKASPLAKRL